MRKYKYYYTEWETQTMDGFPSIRSNSAFSYDGIYLGSSVWAYRLVKKYGIQKWYKRTKTSTIASIGYNPDTKKWYGWSHRAICAFRSRKAAARFAESVS